MIEVPKAAIELAKRFEGFERKVKRGVEITAIPYVCPAGFWTIGYGHLCDPKHLPITEAEAEVYECLRGEDIRDLLVACGASRYLSPESTSSGLSSAEKAQIRKEAGLERASWENQPEDFTIRGLAQLLKLLPDLQPTEARVRAGVLWDALADLEGRGSAAFYGSYKWGYFHEAKAARFDAAFIRALNQTAWVPDANGELVPPGLVVFDTLGWKPNPFLLTKIAFKPPIIDQLAKEAGIDPAALDLLRKYGITSVTELASRLGIVNPPAEVEPPPDADPKIDEPTGSDDVYGDATDLYGDDMPDIPPGTPDPDGGDGIGTGGRGSGTGNPRKGEGGNTGGGKGGGHTGGGDKPGGGTGKGGGSPGKRTPGGTGGRPFISYIGTHPDEGEADPDGLDQAARMNLEELAIRKILAVEPRLNRTPAFNAGYDLVENNSNGQPIKWVEVKAMTGTLRGRPVGLSHTQFEWARQHGAAFWLYVVEEASSPDGGRILRIQDPAAHARTFTFDHGWEAIAKTDPV